MAEASHHYFFDRISADLLFIVSNGAEEPSIEDKHRTLRIRTMMAYVLIGNLKNDVLNKELHRHHGVTIDQIWERLQGFDISDPPTNVRIYFPESIRKMALELHGAIMPEEIGE